MWPARLCRKTPRVRRRVIWLADVLDVAGGEASTRQDGGALLRLWIGS